MLGFKVKSGFRFHGLGSICVCCYLVGVRALGFYTLNPTPCGAFGIEKIRGPPKITGSFLGVPTAGTPVFWDLCVVPPVRKPTNGLECKA